MPERKDSNKQSSKPSDKPEIDILGLGKRIGLSFAEMNELRVRDLFDMADFFFGRMNDEPREATQEDIDAFYRG
ncbi:hypothetical protein EXW96_26480 [Paenibacillus sp. JMULE4]|nr:hypothetical protein [Paenibacillus sp. JMULE4]